MKIDGISKDSERMWGEKLLVSAINKIGKKNDLRISTEVASKIHRSYHDSFMESLHKTGRARIRKFGTFAVLKSAPRHKFNFITRDMVLQNPKNRLVFRPSVSIKPEVQKYAIKNRKKE